jgi:hypothetical protein
MVDLDAALSEPMCVKDDCARCNVHDEQTIVDLDVELRVVKDNLNHVRNEGWIDCAWTSNEIKLFKNAQLLICAGPCLLSVHSHFK